MPDGRILLVEARSLEPGSPAQLLIQSPGGNATPLEQEMPAGIRDVSLPPPGSQSYLLVLQGNGRVVMYLSSRYLSRVHEFPGTYLAADW